MPITTIALDDLSSVTGGQTAAPILNNGTSPVTNTPNVTTGVGNMNWSATRNFGGFTGGGGVAPSGGGGGGGGGLPPPQTPNLM